VNISAKITPTEWRWVITWSLLILVLSGLPYFIALWATPEGWQFGGILVNPLDSHSYMAKMQQGVAGYWLFHLTYTPEPHAGALIFTFYLVLGHLAALVGAPKILIFHLARLLASLVLLLVAFRFIARIIPDPGERRLAFALLSSASGLGWLGAIFGAFPIDLWVPEAFVPYSIYANPHFPLAMTLMLIIFEQVAWPPTPQSPNLPTFHSSTLPLLHSSTPPLSPLRAGLTAFLLAMILPFALLTVWAVLFVFLGWQYLSSRRLPWLHLWPALGAVLLSAPVILYQYWVSVTNPVLAGWGAQNITSAPPILDFIIGYGLVGVLALAGGGLMIWQEVQHPTYFQDQNSSKTGAWLVFWWAVTTIILVYVPFDLQRRLITGLHIPLTILAAIGLKRCSAMIKLTATSQRLLAIGVVTLGVLGTLFVWSLPVIGALQSPTRSAVTALLFMRRDEIAAFDWLQNHVGMDDVILTSSRVGLFIPGQTGARSFYGHPFETIEASVKEAQVTAFYRGEITATSPAVDFIIYGPSERALGQPQILATYPVVFSAGEVTIYKVSE
jgi:hypothetical protein